MISLALGFRGLAAGDDGGAAGVLEQRGQAGAGGHGDDGHAGQNFGGPGTLPVAAGPIPVLQAHVVNLDFIQVAVADAQGQRRAGVFGVDVDADRRAAADDDRGLGDGVQAGAQYVNAQVADHG